MKRAVSSTLAAESQAALDGLRHMEWMSALLAECVYSEFSLEEREDFISPHLSVLMVDCKSVFDHLNSQGCPSSVSDKVAALDLVAIRSHLRRLGVSCRWIPTRIQLADSLTKNDAEAIDLLRSTMRRGRYEISDEDEAMEARAHEKERRLERGKVRKAAAEAKNPDGSFVQEKKDFWLGANSRHYLAKIVKHAVDESRIIKIRVHQKPRTERMVWGETTGFPVKRACEERLTIMRLLIDEDGKKMEPVQEIRDNWTDVPPPAGKRWIGATVLLRR